MLASEQINSNIIEGLVAAADKQQSVVNESTATEVLMQKDHVTQWPPTVIDMDKDKGMWFLPGSGMGPMQPKGLGTLKAIVEGR